MMADELGLNGTLARRCGLLHDVGKAADHEMEGGHPKIGAELAKRYGETSKEVLHAIAGHHDDITVDHIYTVLVAAADAISASRPGARRETLEKYVKRLEELEALAKGFPGTEHAYPIQRGRGLRVIANAENAAGGSGLTPRLYRQLRQAGVDLVTLGDHIYKKAEVIPLLESDDRLCKPANFPPEAPGRTWARAAARDGTPAAAVSL